jgi:hypothetical protein
VTLMTNFLMVLMFFVTPPAAGNNRAWTLQSTQSSEFNSWEACDDAIRTLLIPAMQSTDTVSVFGWCVPKDHKGAERDAAIAEIAHIDKLAPRGRPGLLPDNAKKDRANIIANTMPVVGSCYSYVPAAVVPEGQKNDSKESFVTGLAGSCHSRPPR